MTASFGTAARAAAGLAATLGWTPDIFWAATPADLRAALGLDAPVAGIEPAALKQLMEAFPDG